MQLQEIQSERTVLNRKNETDSAKYFELIAETRYGRMPTIQEMKNLPSKKFVLAQGSRYSSSLFLELLEELSE